MAIEQKRYKICGGICVCIFTQCLYILLLFLLLLYDIYDYFTGDRKNQKLFTIIIYCELCFVLCCVEANRTVLFLYYIMFLFDSFIFRFYSPGTLFIVWWWSSSRHLRVCSRTEYVPGTLHRLKTIFLSPLYIYAFATVQCITWDRDRDLHIALWENTKLIHNLCWCFWDVENHKPTQWWTLCLCGYTHIL